MALDPAQKSGKWDPAQDISHVKKLSSFLWFSGKITLHTIRSIEKFFNVNKFSYTLKLILKNLMFL